MTIIAPLLLASAISISSVREPSGNEQDAYKAIAKAYYKQVNLDEKMKELEKKILSEELRKYGSWATTAIKIRLEQRITYEWTF